MKLKIQKVAYHRNGVSGEGFNVITFKWRDGNTHRSMVAILFKEAGQCAVLDINETLGNNIAFARGNSWRGDDFEPELRAAIKQYDKEFDRKLAAGQVP